MRNMRKQEKESRKSQNGTKGSAVKIVNISVHFPTFPSRVSGFRFPAQTAIEPIHGIIVLCIGG